jgi:hypothetical protein
MLTLLFSAAVSAEVAVATAVPAEESRLAAMSILSKGLFTTLLGLVGVFLVLTLFYFSIKAINRPDKKKPDAKE